MNKFVFNSKVDWEVLDDLDFIKDMTLTEQDSIHHQEGNVYIHTRNVCSEVGKLNLHKDEKEILLYVAVFHDIEKRNTVNKYYDGDLLRISNPNHSKLGEFTTRDIIYKNNLLDFNHREEVCMLVRMHGFPYLFLNREDYIKKISLISCFSKNKLLSYFAECDMKGRICNDAEMQLSLLDLYREECKYIESYDETTPFMDNYSRFKFFQKGEWYRQTYYNDCKSKVYMLSGFPGVGKDYYYKNNLSHLPMLSLDDLRIKNKVKRGDKKKQGQMIQEAIEIAKSYLRKNQDFVFNATNLTKDTRGKWLNIFHQYNSEVTIIYLETPYEKLIEQNNQREDSVPVEAINKMINFFQLPRYDEAHNIIFKTN